MPSFTPHSSSSSSSSQHNNHNKKDLSSLLAAAAPFLRGELEAVDPSLPALLSTLRSVGAGECWHKHGTFLAHLSDVYRILKLWSAPDDVALCGLYHSAYSNSYVNLAIFDPSTSRERVKSLLGPSAERLVHLFCVVNRQTLIHDDLLFHYSDAELADHLALSGSSLANACKLDSGDSGAFDASESRGGRRYGRSCPRRESRSSTSGRGRTSSCRGGSCGRVRLMTMADFSDQLFGFQDDLFDNDNGKLEFAGNSPATALWPGNGKPGLWLNSISRMGALYTLILREEELYLAERKRTEEEAAVIGTERDEGLPMAIPPVFRRLHEDLDAGEQVAARDLYWEAVCGGVGKREGLEKVEGLLRESIGRKPLRRGALRRFGAGLPGDGEVRGGREGGRGRVRLLLEWGSGWDKRVSWEGWVAWGRVLLMKAREKDWPQTSWGILNLGLVR
ncbi:Uncharacterized protein M6B38_240705 [Iris pallida]|uniref:DUF6817 domain-containing protein n=1 Tax=Iris pallida TaxID=29817 RepID=A0AAX6DKG9_IRIPA|nr:Uncharacterized protein M6B38_240705 [Iris pallida]